jgi:acetoin utilization protein AcuB
MKVKNWMTANPLTVKPSTPVMEAAKLMKEHGIRRLPVVKEHDKVVGLVTHRNILEASPSAASSLSIHELNYLISRLEVREIMHPDPITVSPEDSVMEVIMMGHQKGIGAFPVLDRGRLVGIVSEADIFRAVMHIFGDKDTDSFVVLANVRLKERVGAVSRIASVAEGQNVPVLGMFSLPHRRTQGNRLYMRLHTSDPSKVVQALTEAGYKVEE